ncbi:MAG TPA: EamA family transporter [Vicinamibacterales bacterium]|nr:EamA family transporter [Vicinamibacterales bacterium]
MTVLSRDEIGNAAADVGTLHGLLLAFGAVAAAAFGNVLARHAERVGAPLQSSVAWSMVYGPLLLALAAFVIGRRWTFDLQSTYVFSLMYLAAAASVLPFLLYFGLARRRGLYHRVVRLGVDADPCDDDVSVVRGKAVGKRQSVRSCARAWWSIPVASRAQSSP